MKVFKTKVREYPLSNAWATKIKHLKFSESETEGNIKIRVAIYNLLLFVCDFSRPSINYCFMPANYCTKAPVYLNNLKKNFC
jgi:hypothetical protein